MFEIHEETTGIMHLHVTHFIRESALKPFTLRIMGNSTIGYSFQGPNSEAWWYFNYFLYIYLQLSRPSG